VLLGFVIVGFFIWGRGVFCGWLCPFGALQELLAKLAQRLGVAQISLSHRLQRRLWPLKYVVLAGLMVAALQSATALGIAAEVEPFKTAITLQFARPWPFVLYVVLLLVAGLFVERAFCRFLCPLGAIMALGGKLRLISALKRRSECGSPCQLCARRCPIQAIAPDGRIDMDECFYCLDCQIIYYDVSACPPLVLQQRRTQAG
jgi:NosR/NirI family nitrous oxide reductase transcriptional regulator